MNSVCSRPVIPRLLLGLVLVSLMLSSTGCATSKPAPDIQVRERVVTVPKLFLQHLRVEPLQGQSNEDLERQRNDALEKVQQANTQLDKIGKWSDDEATRSSPKPASTSSSRPSYQTLKTSIKQYVNPPKGEVQ